QTPIVYETESRGLLKSREPLAELPSQGRISVLLGRSADLPSYVCGVQGPIICPLRRGNFPLPNVGGGSRGPVAVQLAFGPLGPPQVAKFVLRFVLIRVHSW